MDSEKQAKSPVARIGKSKRGGLVLPTYGNEGMNHICWLQRIEKEKDGVHRSLNNGVKAGLIEQSYLNSDTVLQKPAWAIRAPNRVKL